MIDIFTFNEMRSTRTLLKLLRRYIRRMEQEYFTGICGALLNMREEKLITTEEYDTVYDFISKYKSTGGYWWPSGNKQPRIKWLRKRIKELK